MKLTEKQQMAVYERNKNILVSAAAGSGKTSVLTARIAELCEEGADIRKMLVCTFTNAAAAEMRSRISRKLLARAEETNNARLRAQADYASAADICTFHSFCIRLLRENFLRAGLPQRWRVASEQASKLLKDQALEETFAELIENEDAAFALLQRRYTDKKEDRLKQNLLNLYEFTCSLPEQLEWIVEHDKAVSEEKCRELFLKKYLAVCDSMLDLYHECVKISAAEGWAKQQANDLKEQNTAQEMRKAIEKEDLQGLAELLKIAAPRKDAKIPAGAEKDYHAYYLKLARKCRDELKEISPSDLIDMQREGVYLTEQANALYSVLKVFAQIYRELKLEQGFLDYDDILAESYRLLQDENFAAEYRAYYDYIFVDEYQDTNPIQEALIARIVRKDNAFMVGDIKQSIYRFRLADPLIFRERQQRYADAQNNDELLIHMNDNFRSAPEVINGINRAMEKLMSRDLGEIDYTAEEALAASRTDLKGDVEFLITMQEDAEPSAEDEAKAIAERIIRLHDEGTPYSDIAVLLRAIKGDGDVFSKVFARRGIPCINDAERTVPGEVTLFLNLMRVVDNPNTDIPLIAVMRSHLGGFDEEELALIRAEKKDGGFYAAVKYMAEQDSALSVKCGNFLEQLRVLRIYSRSMRLMEFLILLKERTLFEEKLILLPGGLEKAEIFCRFFEDCIAEAADKESLYHLLTHFEQLLKRGDNLIGKKEAADDGNCVRIMTVHKSKGLEFPVVFFARLGKKMRKDDANKELIYTSDFGIVSDIYDEENHIKKPSLLRSILSDVIERQLLSEALRVVYVAMTRAQNKLILSGTMNSKKLQEVSLECMSAKRSGRYDVLSTPMKWLMAAYSDETLLDWHGIRENRVCEWDAEQKADETVSLADILQQVKKDHGLPMKRYQPDNSPLKYGVSALMPEYSTEMASMPQSAGNTGASGTEFGSLVHYFMEHADFRAFEGVAQQLDRMLREKLISQDEADLLNRFSRQIERFFAGETAKRIACAEKVYREVPFNLSVSAESIGKDGDGDVILQGIIDLLFEENGKWVIVDYKSNFVTEENITELVAHYSIQMQLYRRAAEMISRKKVEECILCFMRAGKEEHILF